MHAEQARKKKNGLPHILHNVSQEGMQESILCAKHQLFEFWSCIKIIIPDTRETSKLIMQILIAGNFRYNYKVIVTLLFAIYLISGTKHFFLIPQITIIRVVPIIRRKHPETPRIYIISYSSNKQQINKNQNNKKIYFMRFRFYSCCWSLQINGTNSKKHVLFRLAA